MYHVGYLLYILDTSECSKPGTGGVSDPPMTWCKRPVVVVVCFREIVCCFSYSMVRWLGPVSAFAARDEIKFFFSINLKDC